MTTDLRAALRDMCEAIEGNRATSSDRIAAYRALADAPPTVAELLPLVDAGHDVRWRGVDGDEWRASLSREKFDGHHRIDIDWRGSDHNSPGWEPGLVAPADLTQPAQLVEVTP